MSTTMAVSSSSSSRTRSDYNPEQYGPFKYSSTTTTKATSFASSSPVLSRSPTTPHSVNWKRPISSPSHGVVSDSNGKNRKKPCLCSPTTHPGSFRCSMHKKTPRGDRDGGDRTVSYQPSVNNNLRLSAMRNSLMRIGVVEGDFAKRALSALIKLPSILLRRRESFQPRPSRLSVMSIAADEEYS